MTTLRLLSSLLVLALTIPCATSAAQDCVAVSGPDTAVAATPRRATAQQGQADLVIRASVTADEITFARQPKICVSLRGDARLDSVRVVGRRNLSSPVVSGTSYRNVYVAVEILGHLDAACIASRITHAAAADSTGTTSCANLGVRTGTP